MRKDDLAEKVEELKDATTDDGPKTRAELGVTADFIRFEGEELDELPDGWTWDTGGRFITAVRESDTD